MNVAAERSIPFGEETVRALDEGNGLPTLLLHGFPDRAEMWRHVGARLRDAGRRTIAVDLPGMGESSAPIGRGHYKLDVVVGQLAVVLAALEVAGPVDVIGHDWGAALSWALCIRRPDLVRRHVAVSIGHPWAFLTAGPDQMRRSSYMVAWQVPRVTEWAISRNDFRRLRRFVDNRHPDIEVATADLSRPGRLTAGLNWYRANLMPPKRWPNCTVPSLGVLPTFDKYAGEKQMARSARYVDAEWRIERLSGIGHWAPLEAPDRVAEVALAWLDAARARP